MPLAEKGVNPRSAELGVALYRTMRMIRVVEESFVPPILDGEIKCPVHLYSGEEAVAAGICAALNVTDYILGTHRSHGHFLAKGGSLEALVAEVYCREGGCSRGRGGSMHLIDPDVGMLGAAPIVAGTIPLALGAALASRIRGDGRVAVAFFGDGATGEGVLYEAMNFAALKKLPLIFVCENNLYSTHMPLAEIRVDVPIVEIARPHGISRARLDGNDVFAVFDAAVAAVDRCRAADGPVFLELLTYRMRGHVGPNDNIQGTQTDIRPLAEIEEWKQRDPLAMARQTLLASGAATLADFEAIDREIAARVEQAHAAAIASPRPSPPDLERYVFHS
jgi:acetoin:2,6-dichlorophenolindophenol oxidoreductase subunit alpha